MYKLLLVLRYLRRKLAPMFAALAVTLCTAMVIIVSSVMGGFLDMFKVAARQASSDVTVESGLGGFPHYEELVKRLESLPEVAGATAVVRSFGLVRLEGNTNGVEIMGIDPGGYDKVSDYKKMLYWTSDYFVKWIEDLKNEQGGANPQEQQRLEEGARYYRENDFRQYAMQFEIPPGWRNARAENAGESPEAGANTGGVSGAADTSGGPGVVLGIAVSPYQRRDEKGQYDFENSPLRSASSREVVVTVLPVTKQGGVLEPAVRKMIAVNEFKSGLYEIDKNRVYVAFDFLQKLLKMDSHQRFNEETGNLSGEMVPGRAHRVMVRAKEGVTSEQLQQRVEAELLKLGTDYEDVGPLLAVTWQEAHQGLLGAVEKEKLMVTFLFAVVSVVAYAMIAVIFYMIVMEKTRDIGVLRALGAAREGVAGIFLGYGLAIGIVGSLLGLFLAAEVVWNINEIQALLARTVGFQMWNPEVYYFDRIPSQLNPKEVTVIVGTAILASVLGALVPAIAAARLNPVEALRYE
ncbi:MAG: ABC transporter permease [Phycisphaeraceae bacterium]|nr:ABC transporter permease [Phycisphaeraceae bacterium]